LSLEDANKRCGLGLTPHPALSHAFAKASARRPRRGYPSVACLKVRRSPNFFGRVRWFGRQSHGVAAL